MKIANLILLLVLSYSCFAQSIEWERRNGKFGTPTTRFIHSDDGRLYFGTANDGIACTSDSGSTWFSVNAGLDSLRIVSISNDPITGKLFCTTPSGNIYQVNPTSGFCSLYGTVPEANLNLIIGHTGIFYAWKTERGIWTSYERSDSWQKVYSKTGNEAPLTVAPLYGGTVLVGTKKTGITRSTDTGATWTRVFTQNFETGKICSEFNNSAVYALIREYDSYPGYYRVLRSIDDGLTWQVFPDNVSGSRIRDISLRGSAVYMGGVESHYYSPDGNDWQVHAYILAFDSYDFISSTATFGNGTLIYNSGDYTMCSTNGGTSWKEVNRIIDYTPAIVFGTREHLYCISESRMAYSTDGGKSWRGHPNLTPYGPSINVIQTDTTWYAYLNEITGWCSYRSSMSYSTDQGLHWNAMPEFGPVLHTHPYNMDLAVGKNGWLLLHNDSMCVVKTADSLYNFRTPRYTYGAVICSNDRLIFSADDQVYYTDDMGVHWKTVSIPGNELSELLYIPETDAVILTYRGKYSMDNGDTWKSIASISHTNRIYDAKYYNGMYYLATHHGLYAGTDLGSDIRLVDLPIYNSTNKLLTSVLVIGDTIYISGGDGITKFRWLGLTPKIQPSRTLVLCPGDTVTCNVVGNYDSYLWSNGATDKILRATIPGTYTCKVTLRGKTLETDPVSVIQIDSASLNLLGIACRNSKSTYSASLFQGLEYSWKVTGGISYPQPDPNTLIIDWGDSNEGQIELEVKYGHCSLRTSLRVTILDAPNPTISVLGDSVLCPGDSTYLTAPSGYTAYRWSTGQTTQGITVHSEDTYNVTVTSANGCAGTSLAVRIIFKPYPPIPTIIRNGDEFKCTNDSVTYQWYVDGTEVPGANERTFYSSVPGDILSE